MDVRRAKIIVRGNCVLCGKPIDNDSLFFCKRCDEQRKLFESSYNKYIYLLHKETGIPISECAKAHEVAIKYLREKAKLKG